MTGEGVAQDIDLPPGAAVAVVDGTVREGRAATGVVLAYAGQVRLAGSPAPGKAASNQAEAMAVLRAVESAEALGARRLRVLVDDVNLAAGIQGAPGRRGTLRSRTPWLVRALDAASDAGLAVSARVVQGHTETGDLPSLMNDLADLLAVAGLEGGFEAVVPLGATWHTDLARAHSRFAPSRNWRRWAALLDKRRVGMFLGVGPETVEALALAGHLSVLPDGITRRSAAAVYEKVQSMRHGGFFGFAEAEGVEGRWFEEVARGWDYRVGRPGHEARARATGPGGDEEAA